jgi:hypothetical protein
MAAFLLLFSGQALSAKGKLELSFHYSSWSVDILRSTIENALNDALKTEFKEKFIDEIQKDLPDWLALSWSQKVSFESGGNNYGFELRWYPSGEYGSFSVGLSVEKTKMKLSLTEVSGMLTARNVKTNETASGEAKFSGDLVINPLSFHLSFRWDIFPRSRVHPYVTFGFGASTPGAIDELEVNYRYGGTFYPPPPDHTETYQGEDTKTGKQLRELAEDEGEEFPINFLPFVQLNFGLKAVLTSNFHLLIDVGIWDGLLLRGGVAFRF